MVEDLSAFQSVLEAIERARTIGAIALLDDMTTRETDDQDCYPRGLVLDLDRKDPKWKALRFLSKHLDWVSLETSEKCLFLSPPQPIKYHLSEVQYLHAIANSLREDGIQCSPDVYYR